MPVIRNPERIKKRSTPMAPYANNQDTVALTRPSLFSGAMKWKSKTASIAIPRIPSSTGMCPPAADSSGLFAVTDSFSTLEGCGLKASEVEFTGNLFRFFLPYLGLRHYDYVG